MGQIGAKSYAMYVMDYGAPVGYRLALNRDWRSRWYANPQEMPGFLHSDLEIRNYVKKKLQFAAVSKIVIERPHKKCRVTIYSARPGVVIGKKGEEIESLKTELRRIMGVQQVHVNIEEIRKPELDAQLIADSITGQLEKRVMFRRAMKRAVMSTMRSGALGVKVRLSGRLNGSEIARTEWAREGRVPLHTFRADIDYGLGEARTTYGVIGVKVWIFKGEVFDKAELAAQATEVEANLAANAAAAAAAGTAAPAPATTPAA